MPHSRYKKSSTHSKKINSAWAVSRGLRETNSVYHAKMRRGLRNAWDRAAKGVEYVHENTRNPIEATLQ
ncbi:hypothetical protein LguiA_021036 [Lonicera macranthoides]